MYSLLIVLNFISVWCLYTAAHRVEFAKTGIHEKLSKNRRAARGLALMFYLLSTIIMVSLFGFTTGILVNIMLWTLFASLITLFTPFQKVKAIHLWGLLLLVIGVETCLCIY
ncbi:hypothetical protein APS56_11995 [Pseudalgibacter alginicilyticus]|uniref:DUF3325 domain-containing protein n=1 Tax=Pseudalgibacter alginicilyticus TaxID=1736674 RepID=A0A0P0CSJ9_9FLAO|nr:hypothetical protein [Pseudalgibacter alginicilyticus]ALJ05803.1 hypothetical protein APS56_11995 [Pseudalgibacter alginicilyticus]